MDHLHAVDQRSGDRVGHIGGRQEHHLAEVQLDVEVVVTEGVVLGRVEHLQQSCRGVTAPVRTDLVDLVEQDHRVHRPGVPERPHEPSGERSDVGPPVATDLGLVADAAERHAHELAPGRPRDRLADRGLAGARGPDQGQDRAGLGVGLDTAVLAQLAHGQVLGDAVLDFLQAGVVGVEHRTRGDGVEDLIGGLAPRHRDQPVEVGPDHARLARLLAHPLEAAELLQGLLLDGVGHQGLFDLRPVLVGDRCLVVAELLADRLHLLAQEVLALLLLGALLDVLADALAHLQLGQALALEPDGQFEALGDVEGPQQLDLLLVGQGGGVAGRVGQCSRLLDRSQERGDAPVVASQLEDLLDGSAVLALELTGAAVPGDLVEALVGLDPQLAAGAGLRGADQRPVLAERATARPPPGRRICSETSAIVPTSRNSFS